MPQNVEAEAGPWCAFCQTDEAAEAATGQIAPDQIVYRGEHVYVCVPLGQVIPGFLIIAPYTCDPGLGGAACMAGLPEGALRELHLLKGLVQRFFREVLDVHDPIFYEQGRAGGGSRHDATGRFSHHAHLCCFPGHVDVVDWLADHYFPTRMESLRDLPGALRTKGAQPYVYLDTVQRRGSERSDLLFTGESPSQQAELGVLRLKEPITELLGLPGRANWRAWPGHDDVARITELVAPFLGRALAQEAAGLSCR